MGRDLGGLGDGPPKFEVGGRPMHPSPIFREVVLSDACESTKYYELSKKGCHEGIFCSEIEVFHKEKDNICYISEVLIRKRAIYVIYQRFFIRKRTIYVIYQMSDS